MPLTRTFLRIVLTGGSLCLLAGTASAVDVRSTQSNSPAHASFAHREALDDPYAPRPDRPPGSAMEHRGAWSRGEFQSIQVNTDAANQNILGDAANEPSIVVDPTNPNRIAIGWRQFDSIASNFRQAGWSYSQDGGQTWTFPGVIEPGVFRSDPVLDTDADGNFYYLSLTTDFGGFWEARAFRSTDGGVSWDAGTSAHGGDKPWMAIDRTDGPGRGNIYVKWQTFFNCCGRNTFTRSTDDGQSFDVPLEVPLGPTFGTVAVGPDGEVYAAGIEAVFGQNLNQIVLARSTNAENAVQSPSFDLSVRVDLGGSMAVGQTPNPAGLLGQTWVATDHSDGPNRGNVYMLASVDPPGADPLDVMFIRSTDGGETWSAPVRVNDDPEGTNAWQWFGTMSVAPNGRIDCIWNDTRNTGADNISELQYAFSLDTGMTWSANKAVSPAFDSHLGWPNQNKLGDYYDMVSDNGGASIAYAATFNGEQDVYFLRIRQTSAIPTVTQWGTVGTAILLMAGLALAFGRKRSATR